MTKKVEGRKAWKAATFAMLIVGTVFGLQNISMLPFVHADAIITVNSTADDQDDDGECTLREAITASNTDTASGATLGECIAGDGNDTITFNITGAADYTLTDRNGATKDGYTIQILSLLPIVTETLTIDGYSQPGSLTNTAVAPNPLNGTLLVDLYGNDNAFGALRFYAGSSNSTVRGIVIGGFQGNGIDIQGADNVAVYGNYLGTSPNGLAANPLGSDDVGSSVAINIGVVAPATDTTTNGTKIGSHYSSDRNLISGNYGGAVGLLAVDTEFFGNYMGLGADGLTVLGNSLGTGVTTGVITIDYADGVIIGDGLPGGTNVFSGNNRGIQPDYSNNLSIKGNLIGTDYTGLLPRPNLRNGISIGLGTHNVQIGGSSIAERNIIAYNDVNGIETWSSAAAVNDITIENNDIHDNEGDGIEFGNSNNITVLNNDIHDNQGQGLNVVFSDVVAIQSNDIVDNTGVGILISSANGLLVGGTLAADKNVIARNGAGGIADSTVFITDYGIEFATVNNSFLGNEIYDNNSGVLYGFSGFGLGIDLLHTILTANVPQSFLNSGPTPNDASDADTGANGYINFPVLSTATQNGSSLSVALDLDAADSPSNEYRVEFFANDTADSSGHGEGQTFLGATTLSPGSGQTATITLPSGTDLTGKVLSATTTAIDASTNSGFGSTSEFSAVVTPQVLSASTTTPTQNTATTQNQANLGQTGQKVRTTALLTVFVLSSLAAAIVARRKYVYTLNRG